MLGSLSLNKKKSNMHRIYYRMSDGSVKYVQMMPQYVDKYIEQLKAAQLEVIKVVKERET